VQFSNAMDDQASLMKQQVSDNVAGLTGADNRSSYILPLWLR
jgi:hypothetical protein